MRRAPPTHAGTLEGRKYALEGYLAPDTYRVFLSATAESIINTLLEQNNNVYDDVFYTDTPDYYADEDGTIHEVETFQTTLTMDETIILASIIEKEAANSEDFARVSAVFHNRLRMGWRLESDPTATYLSGEDRLIVPEDEIADQNAYNTYFVTGLPVGPIPQSVPGRARSGAQPGPDLHRGGLPLLLRRGADVRRAGVRADAGGARSERRAVPPALGGLSGGTGRAGGRGGVSSQRRRGEAKRPAGASGCQKTWERASGGIASRRNLLGGAKRFDGASGERALKPSRTSGNPLPPLAVQARRGKKPNRI